jgi:hypothetical protein
MYRDISSSSLRELDVVALATNVTVIMERGTKAGEGPSPVVRKEFEHRNHLSYSSVVSDRSFEVESFSNHKARGNPGPYYA